LRHSHKKTSQEIPGDDRKKKRVEKRGGKKGDNLKLKKKSACSINTLGYAPWGTQVVEQGFGGKNIFLSLVVSFQPNQAEKKQQERKN